MSNRKQLILTAFVFIILMPLLPLLVFAGTIQLPDTGQTKCYDSAGVEIACAGTGQDGEIQAGVAWPAPRFMDNGDGTVMDNLTGLVWLRNANCFGTRTWANALTDANTLNSGECGLTDGSVEGDWRLTNVNELESLINANVPNTATWLNTQGFTNVQSNRYWSSTYSAYYGSPNKFFINFSLNGYVGINGQFANYYVWPVRSGQVGNADPLYPANIWKTGQTTSYYVGDDGDLERGIAWPTPRFTDIGNGTVTDNLTGLVWLNYANCINTNYPSFDNDYTLGDGMVTWQHAFDFIKGINNGTYPDCGLGYSDWRLPNRRELRSLIDYSNYGPALPTGHPYTNVQGGYWSSTTSASPGSSYAWIVGMWNGDVGWSSKDYRWYVWPVRSGQVGGSFDYYCDDDSDGFIDSSIDGTCIGDGCVPVGCQTTLGDDCDDNDPLVNPGVSDANCNGIDENCNGTADESYVAIPTTCGIGACASTGQLICVNGSTQDTCTSGTPQTEICNGIDDNCNGLTDEGDVCVPDLVISTISVPSSASAGQVISISDTTKNQGIVSAGASTTKFYLSTDTTLNKGDTYLGSRRVSALAVGALSSGRIRVTIPTGTSAGTYYIITVADANKVIVESNEKNNNRSRSITITSP